MAKSGFMSMRWLREHLKGIIWGTIILFVLSIFVIGYGTSRAVKQQEQRKKDFDDAERRARAAEEAPPPHLAAIFDHPALTVAYPIGVATAAKKILTVKDVYQQLSASQEYRQLLSFPPNLRQAFGSQIKERLITHQIDNSLIELYAKVHDIRPMESAETLIARERQRLTPAEFERQLRQQGITEQEFGQQRMDQETLMALFRRIAAPIPAEKVTPEFIQEFYETNSIRFLLEDEISFRHFVINPETFNDIADIDAQEIKRFYDTHTTDFMTGPRLAVKHVCISPQSEKIRTQIDVRRADIQEHYTDNLESYKLPEKVKARHILLKPRNTFNQELTHFSVALRDFQLADDAASPARRIYSFHLTVSEMKPGIELTESGIQLVTKAGERISPTPESLALNDSAIELPLSGSPAKSVQGRVTIIIPEGAEPQTLELHDQSRIQVFDVAAAHDQEASFAAAEKAAEQLLERLKNGEDFASLAKSHSQDDGSRESGGDLGEFARGQMVKPFEEAAFAAKVGDLVGPVRSQFGQHLIKVEAKLPGRVKPLSEVEVEIRNQLMEEKVVAHAQHSLELAKDSVYNAMRSFDDYIKEFDGQRLPVFAMGALDEAYDTSDLALLEQTIGQHGEILPAIQDALFSLKKGDLSPVIKTAKGHHLFLVEDVLDSIPRKLTKALQKDIKERILKEKQWQAAEKKATELQQTITSANFAELASDTTSREEVDFGPMPISENPGFSDYALTSGVEQFSENGLTYLPQVHEALSQVIYPKPLPAAKINRIALWQDKIIGPVKSNFGYHFLQVTAFETDRREPFDEVKDDLRNMLVQIPTEAAIQEAFQQNKSSFDRPQKVKVRQMLLADEEAANQVCQRLQQGEIFDLLARQYSISGSRDNDGISGEFARGQLPPALEEEIWSLQPGKISKPHKTSYGYVVSLLEAIIPAQEATLNAEVTNKVKADLQQQYQESLLVSFMKGLRRQAFIVRHEETLTAL